MDTGRVQSKVSASQRYLSVLQSNLLDMDTKGAVGKHGLDSGLDWTLDWTLDCTLDWTLDSIFFTFFWFLYLFAKIVFFRQCYVGGYT